MGSKNAYGKTQSQEVREVKKNIERGEDMQESGKTNKQLHKQENTNVQVNT